MTATIMIPARHAPPRYLSRLERPKQLHLLENGARLKCVNVDAGGRVFWVLNNPNDIASIEQVLSREASQ